MLRILLTVFFWLHQVIFFFSSLASVGELLSRGGTDGQLNLIPLLLAWIAGTLMFGLGAILAGQSTPKIQIGATPSQ